MIYIIEKESEVNNRPYVAAILTDNVEAYDIVGRLPGCNIIGMIHFKFPFYISESSHGLVYHRRFEDIKYPNIFMYNVFTIEKEFKPWEINGNVLGEDYMGLLPHEHY